MISGEGEGQFVVLDLSTSKIVYNSKVGGGPDVLAFDPGLHRLYVSSESGVVSVFSIEKNNIKKIFEGFVAKHAHSISADLKTHLVYLPLENENGKPVLRIMEMR
jgi:DNA-binding beta-propeller fold protein YncE